MIGTSTSKIGTQVTNIEQDGFWLLVGDGEYFVAFEDYPELRNATIAQIHNFKQSFNGFHWPALDVDIELDALKYPDRLKYKR